ncbi:DUF421 domain-containing protein [Gorillibacterium massiliense]|uniref:DUF421 domain-containing protein n=1 Tax=Gorillibacterium massiliense TaxID=1280390 RepID=UPI0004BC7A07|nr:DUF421 domain-containing protein [Gorillibacterium massiliense]
MSYATIALKLIIGFLGLWIITRFLGKKEISQLTPFAFVSSLILGEIVGNIMYQQKLPVWQLVFAFAVWGVLTYLFEWMTERGKKIQAVLDGKPSILIREGKIDRSEMKRNKLDFEQLRLLLRMQNVFSLREVHYALYETSGVLTVMKKTAYETVKNETLQLSPKEKSLPFLILEDGSIQHDALQQTGKTEEWLIKELRNQGFPDYRKVLYAEWTPEDGLFVSGGHGK